MTFIANLCKPKQDLKLDTDNFEIVKMDVEENYLTADVGDFIDTPFTFGEIKKSIKRMHFKKACDFEDVSSEGIFSAGDKLISVITALFNMILKS